MSPARACAAIAVGASTVLSLVTCGHAMIRSDKTAEFVIENVQKDTGFKPVDVTCPNDVEATVGVEFDCRFAGPTGPYLAHLTIARVEHDEVTYEYGITPIR